MSDDMLWSEVWIDSGSMEYILILRSRKNGEFEIYDPTVKRVIHTVNEFDKARIWLREDEYEKVTGRYHQQVGYYLSFGELSDRAMEIREQFGDFELANGERKWTREDVMMGFVGDVGDLAKLVMAHQNIRSIPDKVAKLKHELADCLWSILVLARMYDVDLESAFLDTMNELDTILDAHAQQKNESI